MKLFIATILVLLASVYASAQDITLIQPPTTGIQGTFTLPENWFGPEYEIFYIRVTSSGNSEGFSGQWGTVEAFEVYPELGRVYLRLGHTTVLLSTDQIALFLEWKAKHTPPNNLMYVSRRFWGDVHIWLYAPETRLF